MFENIPIFTVSDAAQPQIYVAAFNLINSASMMGAHTSQKPELGAKYELHQK